MRISSCGVSSDTYTEEAQRNVEVFFHISNLLWIIDERQGPFPS
jgi:hypothetical protein